MNELIMVGAGGLGRELLQWVKDINKIEQQWTIKGFIDDRLDNLDGYACSHSVIGRIADWTPSETEVFACAIADPQSKENMVESLKRKGAVFTRVIHPTAIIGDYNVLGEGMVVYPHARITVNVSIGEYVTLFSSSIGHDVRIGDYTTITSKVLIAGGVKIGKRVFIGSSATVVPNIIIGDDARIGAGSVVITTVKPNTTVFGNPATRLP